ncbi:hypothetical protein RCL1_003550 [Eukaryota sp. TZLM3-RCL]
MPRGSSSRSSGGSKSSSSSGSRSHSSSSSSTPAIRFTQSGDIDRRSSAVRSGEVRLTQGGDVDRRSSAVRSGDLRVTQSGQPDLRSSMMHSGYTPEPSVPQVSFNSDGSVRRTSEAVRSGDLLATQSGEIDQRSALIRSNQARVTDEGLLDRRYTSGKGATFAIEPVELIAGDFRDSNAQKQYRAAHPLADPTQPRDVAHYLGLSGGTAMLPHLRGPHLTEQQYVDSVGKVLNSFRNLRMVDPMTNRIDQRHLEGEMIQGLSDTTLVISTPAQERALIAAGRMQTIGDQSEGIEASIAHSFAEQLRGLTER